MRKFMLIIALAVTFGLSLAACCGSKTEVPKDVETTEEATEENTETTPLSQNS